MATKKHPEHVHCAKCGYRGIDANHDCTKVRAATAAVVEQAAKRALDPLIPVPVPPPAPVSERIADNLRAVIAPSGPTAENEAPLPLASRLIRLAFEHGRLFGRPLSYVETHRVGNAHGTFPVIEIKQRCAACCSDVDKQVAIDMDKDMASLELGAFARKAYLQHRCPPVADSLVGFTYEEIEELHAELDRELSRIGERLAKVDAYRKTQGRAVTSGQSLVDLEKAWPR